MLLPGTGRGALPHGPEAWSHGPPSAPGLLPTDRAGELPPAPRSATQPGPAPPRPARPVPTGLRVGPPPPPPRRSARPRALPAPPRLRAPGNRLRAGGELRRRTKRPRSVPPRLARSGPVTPVPVPAAGPEGSAGLRRRGPFPPIPRGEVVRPEPPPPPPLHSGARWSGPSVTWPAVDASPGNGKMAAAAGECGLRPGPAPLLCGATSSVVFLARLLWANQKAIYPKKRVIPKKVP